MKLLLLFIITGLLTFYCVRWFGDQNVIITYLISIIAFFVYKGIVYAIKKWKDKKIQEEIDKANDYTKI